MVGAAVRGGRLRLLVRDTRVRKGARVTSAATARALMLTGGLIVCLALPGRALSAPALGPCGGHARVDPGAGVGPLRLGMPVADVERLLGTPPMPVRQGTVAGVPWEDWYFFPRTDVEVFAKDSAVVQIVLGAGTPDTRGCATAEGIQLGSPAAALRAAYGAPDGVSIVRNQGGGQVIAFWVYDKRGLQVILDTGNDVLGLEIFTSGTFCSVQDSLRALGWPRLDCAAFTPPLSGR